MKAGREAVGGVELACVIASRPELAVSHWRARGTNGVEGWRGNLK